MTDNHPEQTTTEAVASTGRRFLQFRLRTVLVLMTLACVIGGVIMWPILQHGTFQATWNRMGATLNEDASYAEEVTRVSLSGTPLTELPAEFYGLTNLTAAILGKNQLAKLPAKIGMLTNLIELNLEGNQLTELPVEIGDLTKLKWLFLQDNRLAKLPAEFGNLNNLTILDLSDNQLTDADLHHLETLRKIYILDLRGNKFTEKAIADLKQTLPISNVWHDFDDDDPPTAE